MAYGTANPVSVREASRAIPEAPRDRSHVQSQMERSAALAEELKGTVDKLEERIAEVLRQEPEPGSTQEGKVPMLVGHAVALSNHNDKLEYLCSRLNSILNRLEL